MHSLLLTNQIGVTAYRSKYKHLQCLTIITSHRSHKISAFPFFFLLFLSYMWMDSLLPAGIASVISNRQTV